MFAEDCSEKPDAQIIEDAETLLKVQHMLALGKHISETAKRRREAGKPEPRGLGS